VEHKIGGGRGTNPRGVWKKKTGFRLKKVKRGTDSFRQKVALAKKATRAGSKKKHGSMNAQLRRRNVSEGQCGADVFDLLAQRRNAGFSIPRTPKTMKGKKGKEKKKRRGVQSKQIKKTT